MIVKALINGPLLHEMASLYQYIPYEFIDHNTTY